MIVLSVLSPTAVAKWWSFSCNLILYVTHSVLTLCFDTKTSPSTGIRKRFSYCLTLDLNLYMFICVRSAQLNIECSSTKNISNLRTKLFQCEVIMHYCSCINMVPSLPVVLTVIFQQYKNVEWNSPYYNGFVFNPLHLGHFVIVSLILRGLRQKICLGKQPSCTASSNINWCHLT